MSLYFSKSNLWFSTWMNTRVVTNNSSIFIMWHLKPDAIKKINDIFRVHCFLTSLNPIEVIVWKSDNEIHREGIIMHFDIPLLPYFSLSKMLIISWAGRKFINIDLFHSFLFHFQSCHCSFMKISNVFCAHCVYL